MSFSLNEIEALAKRAARGAGYDWGLAEDTARATRWLCSYDLDGCGALAQIAENRTELGPPLSLEGILNAGGTPLCPVTTGAAVADYAPVVLRDRLEIASIERPVFLLPFAQQAARVLGDNITVSAGQWRAVISANGLSTDKDIPDFAETLSMEKGGTIAQSRQTVSRASPAQTDLETLLRFAHRTYAPATEESRRLGAG